MQWLAWQLSKLSVSITCISCAGTDGFPLLPIPAAKWKKMVNRARLEMREASGKWRVTTILTHEPGIDHPPRVKGSATPLIDPGQGHARQIPDGSSSTSRSPGSAAKNQRGDKVGRSATAPPSPPAGHDHPPRSRCSPPATCRIAKIGWLKSYGTGPWPGRSRADGDSHPRPRSTGRATHPRRCRRTIGGLIRTRRDPSRPARCRS